MRTFLRRVVSATHSNAPENLFLLRLMRKSTLLVQLMCAYSEKNEKKTVTKLSKQLGTKTWKAEQGKRSPARRYEKLFPPLEKPNLQTSEWMQCRTLMLFNKIITKDPPHNTDKVDPNLIITCFFCVTQEENETSMAPWEQAKPSRGNANWKLFRLEMKLTLENL